MAIKAYIIHNFSPRWFINCKIALSRIGHWLNNKKLCCGIVEWKEKVVSHSPVYQTFSSKLSEDLSHQLLVECLCSLCDMRGTNWVYHDQRLSPLPFWVLHMGWRIWTGLRCHVLLAAHSLTALSQKCHKPANTITGCRMSRKGIANKLVALRHCGPDLEFVSGRHSVLWKTQT